MSNPTLKYKEHFYANLPEGITYSDGFYLFEKARFSDYNLMIKYYEEQVRNGWKMDPRVVRPFEVSSWQLTQPIDPFDVKPYFSGSGIFLYSSSALPDGITFFNGVLAGTPTTGNVYEITITATNEKGSVSQVYPISWA